MFDPSEYFKTRNKHQAHLPIGLGKRGAEDQYRRIFQAQLLKDYAMAYKINKMIKADTEEQKYLIIAGFGHLKHFCGVPERVLEKNP